LDYEGTTTNIIGFGGLPLKHVVTLCEAEYHQLQSYGLSTSDSTAIIAYVHTNNCSLPQAIGAILSQNDGWTPSIGTLIGNQIINGSSLSTSETTVLQSLGFNATESASIASQVSASASFPAVIFPILLLGHGYNAADSYAITNLIASGSTVSSAVSTVFHDNHGWILKDGVTISGASTSTIGMTKVLTARGFTPAQVTTILSGLNNGLTVHDAIVPIFTKTYGATNADKLSTWVTNGLTVKSAQAKLLTI